MTPPGSGDHTFERAPHLLLPLVGGALRLLAGLAVEVLAAKARLTAQLGNSVSGERLFLHACPAPGDHPSRAHRPHPQPSANPQPPKQKLKHPYHPGRRSHVGFGESARAAGTTQHSLPPSTKKVIRGSLNATDGSHKAIGQPRSACSLELPIARGNVTMLLGGLGLPLIKMSSLASLFVAAVQNAQIEDDVPLVIMPLAA